MKKNDTGIFTRYELTDETTEKAWQAHLESAYKQSTLDARLSGYENMARKILDERFVNWESMSTTELESFSIFWRERDPVVCDAIRTLLLIRRLKRSIEEGEIERAAVHAIQLAETALTMSIRPHEKPAMTGRKALSNLQKGREYGIDRYSDPDERHRVWAKLAATMKGSQRRIADRIARNTGDNAETIRKTLRKKST